MATVSLFVKGLFIYVSIGIILFAGGVRFSDLIGLSSLITISDPNAPLTDMQNQVQINQSLKAVAPNVNEQTSFANTFTFIDVLRAVRAFVLFIVDIVFSVFALFLPFPFVIQLFIGVPIQLAIFVGLIYFGRSGQ